MSDAQTGLSYMQQRYYDPMIGRFLSVDPVTAYENPIGAFNRYWYAANNPYRFVDPDGRQETIADVMKYADPVQREAEYIAAKKSLSLAVDLTPGAGDAKGIYEAYKEPTVGNVVGAVVGLVPVVGDAGKAIIKNADSLIEAAGKLERLKGGVRQGRVEGNASDVFKAIAEGGEKLPGGRVKLQDGSVVGTHTSKSTGSTTIDINKGGKIYKIRVEEPKK